jgi:superfamily II DNA or RNA helicase
MVQIIVENTTSKLLGANSVTKANIDKKLSITTPGCWFNPAYKNGYWDGMTRFYDRKTNTFPTGLLRKVVDIISDGYEEGEYEVIDNRTGLEFLLDPTKLSEIVLQNSEKQLRDYQVNSFNKLASNTLKGMIWQRGVLNLATNAGKTVIAEAIIQDTYPKLQEKYHPDKDSEAVMPVFLFVTHSKEIAYQAKNSFEKDLGIDVGLIGDGKWNVKSVTVGIVSTMYSRFKNKKPEFTDLSNRVVAFVGDEVHHSTSTSYYEVLAACKNAALRVGLTGTVEKDAVKRTRLFAITGEVVAKVTNDYLIKHDYSAKPECFMIPVDYPDVDNIRLYGRDDDYGKLDYNETYVKGIVGNMWRNFLIAKICEMEVHENHGQVLVLVDRLEHGQCIQECFQYLNSDIRQQFLFGELNSETRQGGLKMLVDKEVDVLIATTILDEGVDVPNINALVYARGGKSIRKLLQGIGRGLRKKEDGSHLRIYDFIDDTAYILIRQSQQRLETMMGEKFSVKKLKPNQLGITDKDFQDVMRELDTTYDDKYKNIG